MPQRRARSVSCWPNAPRRRASSASCSTAAPISITAGSRHWPTPPARAGSISEGGPMARTQREGRRGDGDRQPREREESEFTEKLVGINRVAKVVKGGRRFGFAALVIVGDRKGRVGYGSGKAREVPEAIRKATGQARKSMIRVPLRDGRTLHHDIADRYGAGRVIMRAAKPGTGIIAGGPMRAIFEALGVQDIVAKSVGSSNPHNMIKATFAALSHVTSPRAVAARRGKKVAEILGRREAEVREGA